MSNPSAKTQQLSIKRRSSLNLLSAVKKVILEEASDTSDILNVFAQHRSYLDLMKEAQDKSLAQAMIIASQPREPQHQQMLLEIVHPGELNRTNGAQVKDRRKIKLKRPSSTIHIINSKEQSKDYITKVVPGDINKEANANTAITQEDLICQSIGHRKSNLVKLEATASYQSHHRDHFPIAFEPSTTNEGPNQQSVLLDQATMIEIQDEDHNHIMLPPELQEPILQLLSTRGANLRKITFTHNDVIQTIEIVPPDFNSTREEGEGTHLILTPGGVIDSHS